MLLAAMASVNFSAKSTTALTYTTAFEYINGSLCFWAVAKGGETDSDNLSVSPHQ